MHTDRLGILLSTTNKTQSLIIFFIIIYALRVSGGFFRPSSGAQELAHSIWYVLSLLAATASGSSKQAWHIPDVMCTVLELLMMGGETARNTWSVNNNKEYYKSLRLVGCT